MIRVTKVHYVIVWKSDKILWRAPRLVCCFSHHQQCNYHHLSKQWQHFLHFDARTVWCMSTNLIAWFCGKGWSPVLICSFSSSLATPLSPCRQASTTCMTCADVMIRVTEIRYLIMRRKKWRNKSLVRVGICFVSYVMHTVSSLQWGKNHNT